MKYRVVLPCLSPFYPLLSRVDSRLKTLNSRLLLLSLFLFFLFPQATPAQSGGYIMTVTGPIAPEQLGQTLSHEHVVTDFAGAETVPQPQYERDSAVAQLLPHLERLRASGVTTLVECTPAYIGRDVRLLRELARRSDLQIVTNTGFYAAVDKKYLPEFVYRVSVDSLYRIWKHEWEKGIEGTGIRPGFIKLGVGQGALDSIEAKLLLAATRLSGESGLPIAMHTGDGAAAQDEYRRVVEAGLPASRMIWVHAQNGTDAERIELAREGVWISLDGVGAGQVADYVDRVLALKKAGLLSRVLISHDDGWSVDNEAGTIRLNYFKSAGTPYRTIERELLPQLLAAGLTPAEMDKLLVENPRRAFTIER